jgi:hypothetical protein
LKRVTGSVLGIAVTERGFFVAELNAAGGVTKTGRWEQGPTVTIAGSSADAITAAGAAFRKFVKETGFSTNKAVVGLPAKWITARSWQVPPSTTTAANAILRLAAERQFPPELKDFVFDYAGTTSATEPSMVLLTGTSQQRITQIISIAESAGLNVLAVTSSALALSTVLAKQSPQKILVALSSESTELVVQADNGPRTLRHLAISGEQLASSNGTAAPALAMLGSELMRTSLAAGESSHELLLWDGSGLRNDALQTLRDRYSLLITPARDLTGANLASSQSAAEFGPAAALALLALRGETLPVDYLHSRLRPPKQTRMGRKVYWGIGIAAAIVVGFAAEIWSLHNKQLELNTLNDTLAQLQPTVLTAKAMDAKVKTADGWYADRPSMLDCMEHITSAFPQEGVIWATNIAVRDNGIGTVTGKARDQIQVLAVYDRMKNDAKFSKVIVNDIRQGTGSNSREISFSISFNFNL